MVNSSFETGALTRCVDNPTAGQLCGDTLPLKLRRSLFSHWGTSHTRISGQALTKHLWVWPNFSWPLGRPRNGAISRNTFCPPTGVYLVPYKDAPFLMQGASHCINRAPNEAKASFFKPHTEGKRHFYAHLGARRTTQRAIII